MCPIFQCGTTHHPAAVIVDSAVAGSDWCHRLCQHVVHNNSLPIYALLGAVCGLPLTVVQCYLPFLLLRPVPIPLVRTGLAPHPLNTTAGRALSLCPPRCRVFANKHTTCSAPCICRFDLSSSRRSRQLPPRKCWPACC